MKTIRILFLISHTSRCDEIFRNDVIITADVNYTAREFDTLNVKEKRSKTVFSDSLGESVIFLSSKRKF